MKKFAKKHLFTIIGVFAGAAAGYFYWYRVGCSTGHCTITSNATNSTVYGAIMGGLFLSLFQNNKNKTT